MIMRVTQRGMYSNVLQNMNSSLSQLMESNIQSSSQQRINKPSDDPIGTVRVLNGRDTLSSLGQYRENISMAEGWLSLADSTMTSVSTVLTSIKELAEQASSGTLTDENREQISYEMRQLFEQLISLANTTYQGSSIFAGHKTDTPAFEETLWMTSNDEALSETSFTITGDSDSTILVQFSESGSLSDVPPPAFRYSSDGGETWAEGTYSATAPAGQVRLELGDSVTLDLDATASVTASEDENDTDGTWLWIRPTAVYQGDDADSSEVDPLYNTSVTGTADGTFKDNVVVRVDEAVDMSASGASFTYSYSSDGGLTWSEGHTSSAIASGSAMLPIPGGILTLTSATGAAIPAGGQFVVRPRTADIDVQISSNQTVTINGVGKDIFGGVYADPSGDGSYEAVTINGSLTANVFETVGKLVGYLETNNQSGCQECLADLTDSQQSILNYAASVGGRENRLTAADTFLENLEANVTEQVSSVEDVDLAALLVKISQQELAYQSVLKSSATIMELSLMNYV
ncbi:flagellar hook-associated protein 3 [Desulfovibrio sulfodismutans]|uniref:Flagellar hook-associated protein 3 n=1 Tax=Desulfolutivibrio sulfodismutans TaxID=63561 RepID=A0A7K3NQQ3_9BACT|nr:flagellar hook-associated protein FlgL [Desulfolutivibrio sulfodismutans]NDY57539.1 flagellar hook-associated protein 3 [Desulfolutivibrio sulfodismutans]QLA14332.1 flagellar hook-associated protein 3 [Desulfolutivibrio sulfodismutans DSM 3696]